MTFSLIDPEVTRGPNLPFTGPLSTGVIIGQELVCVGGSFTSLPTGLVTSVANGLLGSGAFGCNGVALAGTAAPFHSRTVDVIKLQVLLTAAGGTASTAGFGNSYTLAADVESVPEPQSLALFGAGGLVLAALRGRLKRLRSNS